MIAYKNTLSVVEAQTPSISNLTERAWACVEICNNKFTHIGVYYCAPSDKSPESVEDLGRILDSFPSNSPTIVGGDFNAADIRRKSHTVSPGSDCKIRVGAWVLGTRNRSTRVPNFSTRARTQTTGNISTRTRHQNTRYSHEYWLSTSSKSCQWYSGIK